MYLGSKLIKPSRCVVASILSEDLAGVWGANLARKVLPHPSMFPHPSERLSSQPLLLCHGTKGLPFLSLLLLIHNVFLLWIKPDLSSSSSSNIQGESPLGRMQISPDYSHNSLLSSCSSVVVHPPPVKVSHSARGFRPKLTSLPFHATYVGYYVCTYPLQPRVYLLVTFNFSNATSLRLEICESCFNCL